MLKIPLQGGGRAVKSFIHPQDLARAIDLTIHKAGTGKCYNLGPEKGTAIRDLVQMICNKMDKRFEDVVEMAPDRLGQDAQYILNSNKAKQELGWKPKISIDEGL